MLPKDLGTIEILVGMFIMHPNLTAKIWSPLLRSPLKSATPPARMNEMKIPSPSSPPTMLNPRPVGPLFRISLRGSLQQQGIQHQQMNMNQRLGTYRISLNKCPGRLFQIWVLRGALN